MDLSSAPVPSPSLRGELALQLAVLAVFQQLQLDVLRARLDREAFPTDATSQRLLVQAAIDHVFGLLKDGFPLGEVQRSEMTALLQSLVFGPRHELPLAS